GLAAAAAVLDWQIGVLVAIGLAAAVAGLSKAERSAAARRCLVGFFFGVTPIVVWLWSEGALRDAFGQLVLASGSRGVATFAARGVETELGRRAALVASASPGELWLLLIAGAGLVLGARRLRESDRPMARLLATYHYGIVAFSVLELQGFGDVFVLLHSAAFFAGLAISDLALRFETAGPKVRPLAIAVAIVLTLAITRPWTARSGWQLPASVPRSGESLAEQRRLASSLAAEIEGRRVWILASEQRALTGRLEAGRFIVWTPATYRYYRRDAETSEETLARMLLAEATELVVCDLGYDLGRATGGRFRHLRDHVEHGRGVSLFVPSPERVHQGEDSS
ncbi:MAG: hypothetical protein ACREQQ_04495, partial [Candidatus Binatia bacterium]